MCTKLKVAPRRETDIQILFMYERVVLESAKALAIMFTQAGCIAMVMQKQTPRLQPVESQCKKVHSLRCIHVFPHPVYVVLHFSRNILHFTPVTPSSYLAGRRRDVGLEMHLITPIWWK